MSRAMSCAVPPSEVWDRKFVSNPPEEEVVEKEEWEEGGKWLLICSELDMAFVDRTWAALQPLIADGTLLMVKAATALLGRETAIVQCYVRGGPEEARRTAGLIRAAVDYHKGIMYYKSNKVTVARRDGYKRISLYMHTYRGRFYVRDPWGNWRLEEENGQRDVSIPSKFRKENYSAPRAMSCPVQPSKVVNEKFVCIPPEEEMVNRQGWEECGKWILTCSELDMSFVDRTWEALQPLLRDGTLLMLKASTALLRRETAVVQCFVRGGPEEAKRTAEMIRAAVDDYKGIMYYKVNKLTRESVARRHGHKNVSRYMHSYKGRFYVRDSWGDWILEEENGQRDVSIPIKFLKKKHSGSEELPSTSPKSLLNLPSSSIGGANWHLRFRLFDRHREYLPESDRVWIVAMELLDEGYVTGISWRKNTQGIEVRLYVQASSSLTSQLDACDRILVQASVRRMMYFTRGTEGHILYSYKYTPEGELYEQTEFAEKFLLQR